MAFVFVPFAVYAQVSLDFPSSFAGFSSQDLITTIENIVRIVLGFIGLTDIKSIIAEPMLMASPEEKEILIQKSKETAKKIALVF